MRSTISSLMPVLLLAAIYTVVCLTGCATIPKPDIDLMIVNGPGNKRCGYNIAKDYDDDGHLKPGAVAICRENKTVMDLSKATIIDTDPAQNPKHYEEALARMKTWIKLLREEWDRGCKAP